MSPASDKPVPASAVNPEYFSSARTIAQEAVDRARSQLAGSLGTEGWEGQHFLQLIADKKLILHARAIGPDGQLYGLGVLRGTGEHLVLAGRPGERITVHAQFSSGAEARRFFRAEILGEPPTARSWRPDLQQFATDLAARLGGWSADLRDITLSEHQTQLRDTLWDTGAVSGAFEEHVLHEAAVLTGPRGEQAAVVHRPRYREQFLVALLRPSGLPAHAVEEWASPTLGIAVGSDPAQAAADIQRRLLPRHTHALWRARLAAIDHAATGIQHAMDRWDEVSDSFCDAQGMPLDDDAYGAVQAERDARAWDHVQTLLTHGPAVLETVQARADELAPAMLPGERWSLRALDAALTSTARIHHAWRQADAALPPSSPDAVRQHLLDERNADGWHDATELAAHTPVLIRLGQCLDATTAAAEHRGQQTPRLSAIPPTPPGPVAPPSRPRR